MVNLTLKITASRAGVRNRPVGEGLIEKGVLVLLWGLGSIVDAL
jgi:hypothetical protein